VHDQFTQVSVVDYCAYTFKTTPQNEDHFQNEIGSSNLTKLKNNPLINIYMFFFRGRGRANSLCVTADRCRFLLACSSKFNETVLLKLVHLKLS